METTLTYLDSYCERAGDAGMWAEPLNAVSNLFFIAAALAAAYAMRKNNLPLTVRILDLVLLVAALFAIGIGSGLWHVIPNQTTVLMDVIPITLFIQIYLIAAMRRLLHFSWPKTTGWWFAYFALSMLAQMILPPDMLNGTVMYLPTYATLIVLTLAVMHRDTQAGRVLLSMLGVWTLSLTFRTLDLELCTRITNGTHFLWHTLNAYMLYRLLMLLMQRASPTPH